MWFKEKKIDPRLFIINRCCFFNKILDKWLTFLCVFPTLVLLILCTVLYCTILHDDSSFLMQKVVWEVKQFSILDNWFCEKKLDTACSTFLFLIPNTHFHIYSRNNFQFSIWQCCHINRVKESYFIEISIASIQ